jgi:hypothetical protein
VASFAQAVRWGSRSSELRIGNSVFAAATCAVLLLQVALIVRHEPFVDEWQALQIAVQSPDIRSLLANLRYEGHPPLWYLVLRGLSGVVGPQSALPVASLVFGLATQGLVLFRSPFPRWLRLTIALSEPILFEYGTISRSYTLGVALTFWALAAWESRRAFWLPLILLPSVDAFFGVFSLAFLAHRHAEKRLWWPGVVAWLVMSMIAAWSVIPAPDFVPVYPAPSSPMGGTLLLLQQFSTVMVPLQWGNGPEWNSIPPIGVFLALWLPFALLCFDQTRNRPLDRIILVGFFAMLLLTYAFSHTLANRHLMLMGILLVALQWRQSLRGGAVRPFFCLWILIGACCGLLTSAVALAMPFDTAPSVASIIDHKNLRHEHWVSAPAQQAQGVSAITGILFEGPGAGCMNDFVRWNAASSASNRMDLGSWVARQAANGRFYLVSQFPLPPGFPAAEIAHVEPGYDGKAYYLYRIGSERGAPRKALPRCVPGMNPLPTRKRPNA